MSHSLLRYFDASHLSNPVLRGVSALFGRVAVTIDNDLPDGAEKTVALRKLLESKDAAVRAALDLVPVNVNTPATPIEELDLDVRPHNNLKRAGFHFVEQITATPETLAIALDAAANTKEN